MIACGLPPHTRKDTVGGSGRQGYPSPSTALAPPSLACPLPPGGFAIASCKTTESFHSFPYPTSPRHSLHRYRYWRGVRGETPTLSYKGCFLLHPLSPWARQVRSTSANNPTAVIMLARVCACMRACLHSFSRIRGATHISVPISRPKIVYPL